MVRAPNSEPSLVYPTAQTSVGEATATSYSRSSSPCVAGTRTFLHETPSQCRIKASGSSEEWPTAHTSSAAAAATPSRKADDGLGLGTNPHIVPDQCTVRVSRSAPDTKSPTAQ